WVGSLEFGLVTIPVRLYPATEPRDVRFHLMDAQGRRVHYRRFVGSEPPVRDGMPGDGPAEAGSPWAKRQTRPMKSKRRSRTKTCCEAPNAMTGLSFFSRATRSDPSSPSGAERSTSRTSST